MSPVLEVLNSCRDNFRSKTDCKNGNSRNDNVCDTIEPGHLNGSDNGNRKCDDRGLDSDAITIREAFWGLSVSSSFVCIESFVHVDVDDSEGNGFTFDDLSASTRIDNDIGDANDGTCNDAVQVDDNNDEEGVVDKSGRNDVSVDICSTLSFSMCAAHSFNSSRST